LIDFTIGLVNPKGTDDPERTKRRSPWGVTPWPPNDQLHNGPSNVPGFFEMKRKKKQDARL
jgi:hypothetical protein